MNWFERLTGFREAGYEDTRCLLEIAGQKLYSRINGRSYGIGELQLLSLKDLRERATLGAGLKGRMTFRIVRGDVGQMHQSPQYAGSLFQVASQFNLLEMASPEVTPEQGVTRYQHDRTQGPACAIAAGAATIYRNYFVPIDDGFGQTSERQLNGLGGVGLALARAIGRPTDKLWKMTNGYALCSAEGLSAIGGYIQGLDPAQSDALGAELCVGLHQDVEVTAHDGAFPPVVSQLFCSALPVAYSRVPAAQWQPFAELVLRAAYEATFWAAVLNAQRGVSNKVLLTRLGGGAFGNVDEWIDAAIERALTRFQEYDLDVRLVSFGPPLPAMSALERAYA